MQEISRVCTLRLEKKVMTKKTKFNLMDCLIILVVIAFIAGGVYILGNLKGSGASSGAQAATIRYTIELAKEDEQILNLFIAAAERGDSCYVGEKERAEAVIKEVTYTPAKLMTNNARTGETFWADIPDKYAINVTLESVGVETESSITAGSGAALKVGVETSVKGKGYAGYGFITSLETVNE